MLHYLLIRVSPNGWLGAPFNSTNLAKALLVNVRERLWRS